jgi:hypothetical protein
MPLTWIVEPGAFPPRYAKFVDAVRADGHEVVLWHNEWESPDAMPVPGTHHPVIFHGSLGLAAKFAASPHHRPGAYCNAPLFACSAWYPTAREWLLHRDWKLLPASELCATQTEVATLLESPEALFVRPDSPLKPFAGRVLKVGAITLRALDHGFYFDDAHLPVIAAPVRKIDGEWRYLVVDRRVVAGSAYLAEGREPIADDPSGAPWAFAQSVAQHLEAPEAVYIADICLSNGDYRLLELNPFSGADPYAMDPHTIAREVSRVVLRDF